jgi:hypothetical protein
VVVTSEHVDQKNWLVMAAPTITAASLSHDLLCERQLFFGP